MHTTSRFRKNPLKELVADEVYAVLVEYNLLDERNVRNYQIRQEFRSLRKKKVPATDAIEQLRERHPYLQYDTIRKIVYKPQPA